MRRSNRSGYITASAFLAVVVVAELASRMIVPTLEVDPGKWPRIEIAQKLDQISGLAQAEEEVEVLFAGSSMMAGGIDPVAFTAASGETSYNAAFAGPSMRTITPWVLDVVEPLLEPDVVVVGIQSRELSDNGPKNIVMHRKFLDSPGYQQAKGSVASRLEGGLEELSFFLRYRRALRQPTQLFASDEPAQEALDTADVRQVIGARGMRIEEPIQYRRPARLIRGLYEKTLVDFSVGGAEYEALVSLAGALRSRGVELVLLNMPVTDDYWAAHADPVGDRAAYHALLEDFVADTGVTLIDAENGFPSSRPFRDPVHLDIEGRRALAVALAEAWDEIEAGRSDFALSCDDDIAPDCTLRAQNGLATAGRAS